jgi:hypothetical protein
METILTFKNINMTKTHIGNPELAFLFDDTSLKTKQKEKSYQELSALYNQIKMTIPNPGDIK